VTYEETLKTTLAVLNKHVETAREIAPSDHIQQDLGLDSLGVMEVVADIEDTLDVHIPAHRLGEIATVEDVARELVKLLAESGR